MASTKTNKAFRKRLKLTPRGKVLARHGGLGHYNAKESREARLERKTYRPFPINMKKLYLFLPWGDA